MQSTVYCPRIAHAAYPAVALFLPEAVELCLRKISGRLAKDIVTAAQFTIFMFQLFQTLTFSGGDSTITVPSIPLMLMNLWGKTCFFSHPVYLLLREYSFWGAGAVQSGLTLPTAL